MNVLNVIREDALAARKARDSEKAIVLTTLIAEICRNTKEPNEDEVFAGIKKFVKNIDKSIEIHSTPKLEYERLVVSHYFTFERLVDTHNDFEGDLISVVMQNPGKYLKEDNIGWFVGQIMKLNGGKANPAAVRKFLESMVIISKAESCIYKKPVDIDVDMD